MLRMEL